MLQELDRSGLEIAQVNGAVANASGPGGGGPRKAAINGGYERGLWPD